MSISESGLRATKKQRTRTTILANAIALFQKQGIRATRSAQIAAASQVSAATLFNYFATKEAIVMTLVSEALTEAAADFDARSPRDTSLEEDLFAHIATGLRRLKPHRKYLQPVLESSLSPVAKAAENGASESIRVDHLESVQALIVKHRDSATASAVGMQLYWTLYTGILAAWADDKSANQEDTLALLDESLKMFVGWLNDEHQRSDTSYS